MSKLVDLVASATTVPAGAKALIRGLAPNMPDDEVRALAGALTRGTTHIAIRADHPGLARAQQLFETGLDAAAELARVEGQLVAAREALAARDTRIAELEAQLAAAQTLRTSLVTRGRTTP